MLPSLDDLVVSRDPTWALRVWKDNWVTCVKFKAHQVESEVPTDQLCLWLANHFADRGAKKGAAVSESPDAVKLYARAVIDMKIAAKFLVFAVRSLPWPKFVRPKIKKGHEA